MKTGLIAALAAAILASAPAKAQQRLELERITLIAGNTPAAPARLYGGRYVFLVTCTTYGTVTLRSYGADGTTTLVSGSYTANGAASFDMMAGQVVDATVSGATGCNAVIGRVLI